jgi:type IV pilus assembly protein PilN
MIRVNLLPQKREARRAAGEQQQQVWLGVLLAVIVLEILGLFFFHNSKQNELKSAQSDNQKIQGQIDDIKKTTSNHADIKAQLAELRDREDAITKLQSARTGPTATLLELSKILTMGHGPTTDRDRIEQLKRDNPTAVPNPNWDPRRLWLTKYSEADRSVKIEGLSRDGEDVAEFLRRLSLSDYFYDAKPLPATEVADKDSKIALKQFAIQAKVRY